MNPCPIWAIGRKNIKEIRQRELRSGAYDKEAILTGGGGLIFWISLVYSLS